jgi:hypothetical protein
MTRSWSGILHTSRIPGGFVINLSECSCTHTKHMMQSGWCINEISQRSRVMYTRYVQTPSSSHSKRRSGCIGTLLAEISRYDVGRQGKAFSGGHL